MKTVKICSLLAFAILSILSVSTYACNCGKYNSDAYQEAYSDNDNTYDSYTRHDKHKVKTETIFDQLDSIF